MHNSNILESSLSNTASVQTFHVPVREVPINKSDSKKKHESSEVNTLMLPSYMTTYLKRAAIFSLVLIVSAFFVAQSASAKEVPADYLNTKPATTEMVKQDVDILGELLKFDIFGFFLRKWGVL